MICTAVSVLLPSQYHSLVFINFARFSKQGYGASQIRCSSPSLRQVQLARPLLSALYAHWVADAWPGINPPPQWLKLIHLLEPARLMQIGSDRRPPPSPR